MIQELQILSTIIIKELFELILHYMFWMFLTFPL